MYRVRVFQFRNDAWDTVYTKTFQSKADAESVFDELIKEYDATLQKMHLAVSRDGKTTIEIIE